MKNKVKTMIAIIIFGIILTSCKHSIDPSVIQSFTSENKVLEGKLLGMKTFKDQTLIERGKKYSGMVTAIDPKKKTAYEKDNEVKSQMNNIQEKLDIVAKEYEMNYISLIASIESNNAFIASIPNSEQNEQSIKSDWEHNITAFNEIIERNNDLQKEMTDLLREYTESANQVMKKYGKTETVKNKTKKKRK